MIFFKPLEKVLRQRYEATEGARKLAEQSLERAAAKTAEYEAAMRAARAEVYQAQERLSQAIAGTRGRRDWPPRGSAPTPPSGKPRRNWPATWKRPRPPWPPTAMRWPARSRNPSCGGAPHEAPGVVPGHPPAGWPAAPARRPARQRPASSRRQPARRQPSALEMGQFPAAGRWCWATSRARMAARFSPRAPGRSARTWPTPPNLRQEAEARAAEVERRLANLESDIAALRGERRSESAGRNRAHARSTPPPKSPRFRLTPNRKSPPPARPPAWI